MEKAKRKKPTLLVTIQYCLFHCFPWEIYQSEKQKPLYVFQTLKNPRQKIGAYKTFGKAGGKLTTRSQVCCSGEVSKLSGWQMITAASSTKKGAFQGNMQRLLQLHVYWSLGVFYLSLQRTKNKAFAFFFFPF